MTIRQMELREIDAARRRALRNGEISCPHCGRVFSHASQYIYGLFEGDIHKVCRAGEDCRTRQLTVLVLLQNAWKYDAAPDQVEWYPGKPPEISRKGWLMALWGSQTGKKLKAMVPMDKCAAIIGEASPKIGSRAHSRFDMEPPYVRAQLQEHKPDLVVLLGIEAQKAALLVDTYGALVIRGPHPVSRSASTKDRRRCYLAVARGLRDVAGQVFGLTDDA